MWKILFLTFLCGGVKARTDEELKTEFIKLLLRCTEKHSVPMTELLKLQDLKVPTDMDSKCLLACAYKKEGAINAKGLYDLQHAYKFAEDEKNGDDKRMQNGKKLADLCNKINDVKVSDGDKGCERAALLFKCLVENGPKLGFKM